MKILSFDVGIVNLAYCILDYSSHKILKWEIISLENTPDHGKLYVDLIKNLDSRPDLLDTIHTVLIEKQPSFNPKMRIIAGCLQTYFYIRGVVDSPVKIHTIKFYSPKHKLKCYTGIEPLQVNKSSKYSQTKKLGVIICEKKLIEYSETEYLPFFKSSKKRDDLSDSYLQALTYILQSKKLLNINNHFTNVILTQKVSKKEIKEKFKNILLHTEKFNIEDINSESFPLRKNFTEVYKVTFPIEEEKLGILLKQMNLITLFNKVK